MDLSSTIACAAAFLLVLGAVPASSLNSRRAPEVRVFQAGAFSGFGVSASGGAAPEVESVRPIPSRNQAADTSGQNAATRAAIETAKAAWREAYRTADREALAALYAPDADLSPPSGAGLQGRGNIVDFLTSTRMAGVRDAKLETREIVRVDDVAYEVGSYDLDVGAPERSPVGVEASEASRADARQATGRYYAIWKAQADGSWRYQVAIWSSNGDGNTLR